MWLRNEVESLLFCLSSRGFCSVSSGDDGESEMAEEDKGEARGDGGAVSGLSDMCYQCCIL